MFESVYASDASGPGWPAARELRSGLSGFGGRPVLHPAWRSEDEDVAPRAAVTRHVVAGRPGGRLAAERVDA